MPYNGLAYFRPTKLGRYILGIDKSYETPATAFKLVEVLLSEDSLIITLSEKNDVLAKELSNCSNRLGDRLFQVSEQSFLKKIRRWRQLEERIDNLKTIASNEPSAMRKFFFLDFRQKVNLLERERGGAV